MHEEKRLLPEDRSSQLGTDYTGRVTGDADERYGGDGDECERRPVIGERGGERQNRMTALRESQIQEACAQVLEYDGWRRVRMEAQSERGFVRRVLGLVAKDDMLSPFVGALSKIFQRCMRAAGVGEPGMADDLFIRYSELFGHASHDTDRVYAQVMWIEWKRPGAKLRPDQDAWHTLERKRNALTLKAGVDFPASIDGFRDWYKQSGLMRRAIR